MKFEQLLKVYWTKSFLYGGKSFSFNSSWDFFFYNLKGVSYKGKFFFRKRFESNYFFHNKKNTFLYFNLDYRKIINMYLSQLTSVNHDYKLLAKYNVIRLYLIKTFRGRSQALGKPSRGQRTWSNSWNAYKCNRTLRLFISEVKKNNPSLQIKEKINYKRIKKKFKKKKTNIKMYIIKKKTNLWF